MSKNQILICNAKGKDQGIGEVYEETDEAALEDDIEEHIPTKGVAEFNPHSNSELLGRVNRLAL